jgi:uncharacterized protein
VLEMRINVAQLLKETVGATRSLDLDGPLLDSDGLNLGTAMGGLKLTKTDRGVWVSGSIEMTVSSECSRCLDLMDYVVPAQLDDEYLPYVDLATGARVRVDEHEAGDADTKSIDDHHELDLSDTLRQYRMAGLLLAPLCKVNCLGICPQCGVNLNESAHDCEAESDPRWEKLRELLR